MTKNIFYIVFIVFCSLFLWSCDDGGDTLANTLEQNLVDSFSDSNDLIKKQVENIVVACKEENYQAALNELAILTSTQINTPKQEQSIRFLANRMRFMMEARDNNIKQ